MSYKPNKLSRFWQELKRRKVIHVITVYASASFVLIELINNVQEPLNLPQGLSTIAIVVLAIGFPFAVVLSWIFDVTPKGVEKTKPSSEVPEEERVAAPNSWRIATYISVVVIVGLISFNLLTRTNLSENLASYGKSIAVLPFINDSQDEGNNMLVNGTMENILNKLCKIKVIRVMNRQSVEPYRDTNVPVSEISKELRVSYVLRGSVRRYGEMVVINVQLVDQNDNTVYSGQFERNINVREELFILESKIAQDVAREIKAHIATEELKRIEKVPTADPVVIQLCQMAYSDFIEFRTGWNREYLESATRLYQQAMAMDSTYPNAITGLGWLYQMKNYWRGQSEEGYLDSVKIYADRALSYDSENEEAYLLQGFYYWFKRDWNTSEESYNKVLEINPNNSAAYEFIGNINYRVRGDFVKAIEYYEEAGKRERNEGLYANFFRWVGHAYMGTGFFDLFEENLRKALVFDGDTAVFYSVLGDLEHHKGNFQKAAEFEARAYSIDPRIGYIGLWNFIYSEQIEEAQKWAKLIEERNPGQAPMAIGCLSLITGDKEKADQQFDQIMKKFQEEAEHSPDWVAWDYGHIEVAMICAYRGQKDEAYMYLDELIKIKKSLAPVVIRYLEINPMFDNLREEERFQKILRKMHADYHAAHELMRLYLEETGKL